MDSRGHRRLAHAAALGFYAFVLLFTFHEADEDVWGRMSAGRLTLSLGRVPEKDVFAYVPTKPLWVDHEWLSGVVFHEIHRRFGGEGLLLLRALLGTAAVAFVLKASSRSSPWAAPFLAIACWPLVAQGFNSVVRAQAFTFFFFPLFVFARKRGKNLWLLPPLTALWANLHGGFVLGPLALLAWAASGEKRRRTAGLAMASLAASLVNPYGFEYWRYLSGALFMSRPEILEWSSAGISDLHIVVGLVLSAVLVYVRRPEPPHLVLLAGAAVASIVSVRFAPLLGLVLPITLARSWDSVFRQDRAAKALGAMLPAFALIGIGLAVSWYRRDLSLEMRVPPDRFPVEAVERLQDERPGNLAVFFNWGEFVLYHLHDTHRVSIDGRYETVYPEEIVEANWSFTRGVRGSERFLDEPPADFALYPRGSGAARLLEQAPGWRLLQQDQNFVLYRRNGGGKPPPRSSNP